MSAAQQRQDSPKAIAIRQKVLGDEHPGADIHSFVPGAALMDWTRGHVWEIWAREDLGVRDRCIVTVTILIVLNRPDFLAVHLRAALRNGLSREEIGEIIAHVAIYAGVVSANDALRVFRQVCDRIDAAGGTP